MDDVAGARVIVVTVLWTEVAVTFKDDTGTRGTPAVIRRESCEEDTGKEEPASAFMIGEVDDETAG